MPETGESIGYPKCIRIVWAEEYVPKAGPHKGKKLISENSTLIPLEVFARAHSAYWSKVDA